MLCIIMLGVVNDGDKITLIALIFRFLSRLFSQFSLVSLSFRFLYSCLIYNPPTPSISTLPFLPTYLSKCNRNDTLIII